MSMAYKGILVLTPEEREILMASIDCYDYFYSTCENTEEIEGQRILIKELKSKITKFIKQKNCI